MNPNEQQPQPPANPTPIPVREAPATPPPQAVVPISPTTQPQSIHELAATPLANPAPVPTTQAPPSPPTPQQPTVSNAVYSMGSLEAKQAQHRSRQLIALAIITIVLATAGGAVVWAIQSQDHSNHQMNETEEMH
jgi:hypothetical protein